MKKKLFLKKNTLSPLILLVLFFLLILVIFIFKNKGKTPATYFQQAGTTGFGQAIRFDGLTGYVKIPSGKNLPDLSGNFTIEMWLKPKGNPFGDLDNFILTKLSSDYKQNEFFLVKEPQNQQGDGPIYFLINQVGDVRGTTYLNADGNHWYHLAVVKNNLNLKLFINGRLEAENTLSSNPQSSNDYPLYIGSSFLYDGKLNSPYGGDIDELRISNAAVYTTDFSPPMNPFGYVASTIALYHFDGNLWDDSWNDHIGTAVGSVIYADSDILPAQPNISPSPSLAPMCRKSCDQSWECGGNLMCWNVRSLPWQHGVCVNSQCVDQTDCICDLPSPTASPALNSPPTITTNSLKSGRKNYLYQAAINGEDVDLSDSLTMTINGLPSGINVKSCQKYSNSTKKLISCFLEGKPTISGKFNIDISLKDTQNHETKKTFLLWIKA